MEKLREKTEAKMRKRRRVVEEHDSCVSKQDVNS